MKQQDTLKRLHWTTDKEQILHILSRVNIKYLIALKNKCRDIQNYDDYCWMEPHMRTSSKVGQAIADTRELLQSPCWKDNEVVEEFNKHRAEVYANTKVECKYDGCVFDVSFKTLKDELKRRKIFSK